MDDTDGKLCLLLSVDPRASYRELADRLGLSVPAVHRRIQGLREQGVVAGFAANLSLAYLGAVRVDVVGPSKSESIEEVVRALARDDRVTTTLEASGHFLYVNGILRDVSELDEFVRFVREAAAMPNPGVAIESGNPWAPGATRPRRPSRELSGLDLRIIRALHVDARKSTTDVAGELGVSAATVRRRLEAMIQDGAIEFGADIDPTKSERVCSIMGVTLEDDADPLKTGTRLLQKYRPGLVYFIRFGNLPSYLAFATWNPTTADLHELAKRVEAEPGVRKVVANIAVAGYRFVCWRDRLLDAKGGVPLGVRGSST